MAVNTTSKQMALTRDIGPGGFMERVQATLAFTATGILSEPAATPHREGRVAYAQRVIANPGASAQMGGPIISMGVNVVNTTTYDEPSKTSTCTIADIDLESQIRTLWNALAGLDTPPAA